MNAAAGGSAEPGLRRDLPVVLAIAVAYVLAGLIGLLIAPPSFGLFIAPPSPFPMLLWPAAGVALAALIVFGVRRWPGVWLGGLVLVGAPGGMAAGDALVALLLATGVAAQAVLGAALTRHLFLKPLPLSAPAPVLRFVLLAGPVSCVVFASVTVGLVRTLDGPLAGLPVSGTWLQVWAGDSLGVALFAPLLLLAWPRMAVVWSRVRWHLVLPIGAAVVALAAANVVAERQAASAQQDRWRAIVDDVARSAQTSLQTAAERLRGVERFFAASVHVTREEFDLYTAPLTGPSSLVGVHWTPRVPHEALAAFEARARRATGRDEYRVHEPGASEGTVPPGARGEHYPVLYAAPEGLHRALLGLDHGFEPERRMAMDEALRDTDGFAIAAGSAFVTGERMLLLYIAHLGATAARNTTDVQARREALLGYVVGEVHPPGLFDDKLALATSADVALRSVLVAADEAPLTLADGFPQGLAVQWQAEVDDPVLPLRIELADLQPSAPNPYYPPIALLSGLFVSTMALVGAGRQAGTDAEVAARTAELREARQAAEAANQAKSLFLATVSHEIRTPMNGVLGMLEVLEHGQLSAHQRDSVGTMRASATTLLTLIDDILDFSKIEAGRIDLERTPLSVPDLVEELCASQATVAQRRGVALRVFVDPLIPERVVGDDTRLRQVLSNLVGNAIKFSASLPDRPGMVAVRATLLADDPLRITFAVEDNGIGIEETAQARLFAPFTQAQASTTRRFGGTGLGLAISRRLVELMGGEIDVTSRPGEGSRFTVTLPFERAAEQPPRELADLSGLHCYLLDDGEIFTEALASYLRHAGATAQRVTDVAQTLHATVADGGEPTVFVLGETAYELERSGDRPRRLRYVRIGRGRRRRARLLTPDCVTLDADALNRKTFLHAVAVAAGRESPELLGDRTTDTLPGKSVPPPTVAQARAENRLILVAEDDVVSQKVIREQLALLGYAAEVVDDGTTALARWRDGGFAVLITDLHMPEMDGYTLAAEIRRNESPGHRIPIVALTANALRGEAARVKAEGMDDCLTKPVPMSVLGRVLRTWLPPPSDAAVVQPGGTSQASDTTRALDPAVLPRFVGDDRAKVRRFLAMYADEAARAAGELRAAAADRDHERLQAIAHKLKSSSRWVGAVPLGELCDELESLAKRGDQAAIEQAMARFDRLFAELQTELAPLLTAGDDP